MPAPVSIAQIHVHSLRLRNGAEALVARAVTTAGVAGYGFSLGTEATPARDMAAWDALARSRNVPLYALFGEKTRERVAVAQEHAIKIDPFELFTIEAALSKCRAQDKLGLAAPHGHPWELSYCVALAAALPGEIVIVAGLAEQLIAVADAPGIAIDWSLEPAFGGIAWYNDRADSPQRT